MEGKEKHTTGGGHESLAVWRDMATIDLEVLLFAYEREIVSIMVNSLIVCDTIDALCDALGQIASQRSRTSMCEPDWFDDVHGEQLSMRLSEWHREEEKRNSDR